jgi:phosphatidylglycerophosphatase A
VIQEQASDSPQGAIVTRRHLRDWRVLLATGLGAGLSPVAPGTVGALWGLPLAWALGHIPGFGLRAMAIGALGVLGVPICTAAARRLGGDKDPGAIVLDEITSLPITFLLVPLDNWWIALAGFGLHRLFDILKPPPARQLEGLPEGLGIMADDWMAAVYSCLALYLLRYAGAGG